MNREEIIKKYGTPTYLFDLDILDKRIEYLKKSFAPYDLVYAVKANTFVVESLKDKVERFEICSEGEFDICKNLEIPFTKMVISGVNKEEKIISSWLKKYPNILKYTIESVNQYKMLVKLSQRYNQKIKVLIRLTSGNQFGVTKEELKSIIAMNQNTLVTIDGIEYFSGTQKKSLSKINKEIDKLIALITEIETTLNFPITEIEYGLGLPVFYYQDEEFSEEEFFQGVKEALDRLPRKKISLELGRSIVASCGEYYTKVVDMKTNQYGNFAIVDGGINHLVYYGQTMAMKIPYYEIIPKRKGELVNYNICGSLCTINDFLIKNIAISRLKLGDVFVFKNVGAYSSTEGISLFLSRDLPKVLLRKNNQVLLVRKNLKTSKLNFPKVVKE